MLEALKLRASYTDSDFDSIYPDPVKKLSYRHFTPFDVSIQACKWLNESERQLRVLDIGCGVGKFCFIASIFTKHLIYGIDIRPHFIDLCNQIKEKYNLPKLDFIQSNINSTDFREYEAFYFFNSFMEQKDESAALDHSIERSVELYHSYESHVKAELDKKPPGTRLITYYGHVKQVPESYELTKTAFDGFLKLWIKN